MKDNTISYNNVAKMAQNQISVWISSHAEIHLYCLLPQLSACPERGFYCSSLTKLTLGCIPTIVMINSCFFFKKMYRFTIILEGQLSICSTSWSSPRQASSPASHILLSIETKYSKQVLLPARCDCHHCIYQW